MKKGRLTLTQKRGLTGYMFCIPWIVGFLLFFIFPVIQTAYYSFNIFDKVTLQPTFAGLKNYVYAFSGDAQFPQKLAGSLMNMVEVPLILIFSYFVALLLRKKFKGAAIVLSLIHIYAQMGKVYLRRDQLEQAMEYFELGNYRGDKVTKTTGYNKAFSEYRRDVAAKWLGPVVVVLVVLVLGYYVFRIYRKRRRRA